MKKRGVHTSPFKLNSYQIQLDQKHEHCRFSLSLSPITRGFTKRAVKTSICIVEHPPCPRMVLGICGLLKLHSIRPSWWIPVLPEGLIGANDAGRHSEMRSLPGLRASLILLLLRIAHTEKYICWRSGWSSVSLSLYPAMSRPVHIL